MDLSELSALIEESSGGKMKKRPRKNNLYSQILKQMEFYFSDANLARDRFLARLLEQNKTIPLDVFLKFNKIRALTGSTEEIAKALGKSQMLQVSEDGKYVQRVTPIQEKKNRDDCSIYVEHLPLDANHDWVVGIFSAYGKVEYVSIPKYKNRLAIKGFAFVEFDTPNAAKNALEAFGSAGCCLPPQMQPEELCSIATYESQDGQSLEDSKSEVDSNFEKQIKDKNRRSFSEDGKPEFNSEVVEEAGVRKMENEEPLSKKRKTETSDENEHLKEEKFEKKKRKDPFGCAINLSEEYMPSESAEPINKEKKKKKRKLENDIENVDLPRNENDENVHNSIKKKNTKMTLIETESNHGGIENNQEDGADENEKTQENPKKRKHREIESSCEKATMETEGVDEELIDSSQVPHDPNKKSKKKSRELKEKEYGYIDDDASDKKHKKRKHKLIESTSEKDTTEMEEVSDELIDIPQDAQDPTKKTKKKKKIQGNCEKEYDCIEEDASDEKYKKKKHKDVEDTSGNTKTETGDELIDCPQDAEVPTKKSKKKVQEHKEKEFRDIEKGDASDEGTTNENNKEAKDSRNEVDEDYDSESGMDVDKSSKKKRSRKRNKSKKIKGFEKKENDPASLGLRILSKKEWSRLRNKYLNLQREKMQGLKKHLARAKYGNTYQSPCATKENGVHDKDSHTKYTPGAIIHITWPEPVRHVTTFKKPLKLQPGVEYVDANEDSTEVHIRCCSADAAQKLRSENKWENSTILEGEAESAYWEKIWKDREDKIKNKSKVRANIRGRDKLLKRAERELGKHIKFDD